MNEGFNLISPKSNNKNKRNGILIDEEIVELIISKKQNIPNNVRIEFSMIITEPDYDYIDNYQ